jgi:hypothetical protein
VPFPRGREVLEVISHLVVAMQARNNPLNRWFPWRQVRRVRRVHECLYVCAEEAASADLAMSWGRVCADCWLAGPCCLYVLQAHKDLFKWGGRMSGLVHDLTASMEETPPPPHTLGAHLLKAQYSTGVSQCWNAPLACSILSR